ncbi:hypothetical protein ACLBXM_18065 [Xanthobacteraceae bacterium A53D]
MPHINKRGTEVVTVAEIEDFFKPFPEYIVWVSRNREINQITKALGEVSVIGPTGGTFGPDNRPERNTVARAQMFEGDTVTSYNFDHMKRAIPPGRLGKD